MEPLCSLCHKSQIITRNMILWNSSVSWFSFFVDGRMKKKNHETRVLVVIVLTSKCKLRISLARITPIQTYLVAQLLSYFVVLVVFPLFLFLFYLFLKTFNSVKTGWWWGGEAGRSKPSCNFFVFIPLVEELLPWNFMSFNIFLLDIFKKKLFQNLLSFFV